MIVNIQIRVNKRRGSICQTLFSEVLFSLFVKVFDKNLMVQVNCKYLQINGKIIGISRLRSHFIVSLHTAPTDYS